MPVIDEIAAERKRQIEVEGWSAEHDDAHHHGEMALSAAAYACASTMLHEEIEFHKKMLYGAKRGLFSVIAYLWRWEPHWFKPKDRRRNLIKAAALLVAEIERLDRFEAKKNAA